MAVTHSNFMLEANVFRLHHLLDIDLLKYALYLVLFMTRTVYISLYHIAVTRSGEIVANHGVSSTDSLRVVGTSVKSRKSVWVRRGNSNWRLDCVLRKKSGLNRLAVAVNLLSATHWCHMIC
jgi:hypothetical protein